MNGIPHPWTAKIEAEWNAIVTLSQRWIERRGDRAYDAMILAVAARLAELEARAEAAEKQAREEAEWITCGMTYRDRAVEDRVNALRQIEGHSVGLGCGKRLKIVYAYRCVECGRWFDRECILHHFAADGDPTARALAASDARAETADARIRELEAALAAEKRARETAEKRVRGLEAVIRRHVEIYAHDAYGELRDALASAPAGPEKAKDGR